MGFEPVFLTDHPHRPTRVVIGDPAQIPAIHRVQAERVDLEPRQGAVGGRAVHRRRARDGGEIAHPAQQAVRDAGRTTRALGDPTRALAD